MAGKSRVRVRPAPNAHPRGAEPEPARSPRKFLGLRAYARWRKERGLSGGTLSAVQKALSEGRIQRACKVHMRCPKGCDTLDAGIDPAIADQDWLESSVRSPDLEETPAEIRAGVELYKRRLLRLKYEREKGTLLLRADVEAERLRAGKATQEALFLMCRRVAPRLEAMGDRRQIQEFLEDEVRVALDRVGRKLAARAAR